MLTCCRCHLLSSSCQNTWAPGVTGHILHAALPTPLASENADGVPMHRATTTGARPMARTQTPQYPPDLPIQSARAQGVKHPGGWWRFPGVTIGVDVTACNASFSDWLSAYECSTVPPKACYMRYIHPSSRQARGRSLDPTQLHNHKR
jgi:hypothetical protein